MEVIYEKIRTIFDFFSFNRYERRETLHNYIRSHYGPFLVNKPFYDSESFYQRIISESLPYINENSSVCDIGCAVGRLTYEWARVAKYSCGIDSSKKFVEFCKNVDHNKDIRFELTLARKPEFICADILTHPFKEKSFDFISCINVIDRVKNPHLLMDILHKTLAPGGTLILSDPYDWALSPTPSARQVQDMKRLLKSRDWEVKKEICISYTVPIDRVHTRTYECHTLIAIKIY